MLNENDGYGRKVMPNTNTMRFRAVCDLTKRLRYEGYGKEEAFILVKEYNAKMNCPPLEDTELNLQFDNTFPVSLAFKGVDRKQQILERYIRFREERLDNNVIAEKLNKFNAACNVPPLLKEEIETIKKSLSYGTVYESAGPQNVTVSYSKESHKAAKSTVIHEAYKILGHKTGVDKGGE